MLFEFHWVKSASNKNSKLNGHQTTVWNLAFIFCYILVDIYKYLLAILSYNTFTLLHQFCGERFSVLWVEKTEAPQFVHDIILVCRTRLGFYYGLNNLPKKCSVQWAHCIINRFSNGRINWIVFRQWKQDKEKSNKMGKKRGTVCWLYKHPDVGIH